MLFLVFRRVSYFVVLMLCLQLTLVSKSAAQFNVRVGYSLGVLSANTNSEILDSYDTRLSSFYDEYDEFRDLRLIYGISLGLRYKFGLGSLEFSWEGLGRTISSVGKFNPNPPAQPSAVTEELRYRLNLLLLTYETNFDRVGVGSSIGRNFLSISELIPNNRANISLLDGNQGQFVARFHLAFNFYGSSTVAFAIKPFIQLGTTDADLSSYTRNLSVSATDTNEDFLMWGLSFAFYNGRQ